MNTGEITGLTLTAENMTSGDKVTKKVGETLTISAIPGDKVALTAEAAGAEGADLTLKWAPNGYMSISEDKRTATISLSADMDVSGEPLTTMVSCVSDPDYQIPVKINVTKERPEKPKITGLNLKGSVMQSDVVREESDATSGKTLELNVFPGESIRLTPSVSGVGGIDTSVALNKNTLDMAVIENLTEPASGTNIITMKVKGDAAAGTVISTEIYCTADTSYRVPVRITVLANTPYVDLLVAKKNGETVDEGLKEITYTGSNNTCEIEVDMGSETEVTLYIAVSANKWSPNTTISETTPNSRLYNKISSDGKLTGYVKLTKTGENASDVNLTFQGTNSSSQTTSFNVTIKKKAGN